MCSAESRRVLAIGIDAAEPTLVRALIDEGDLPCLRALLNGGTWGRVLSPAHIGSGAVWPTFWTGVPPPEHGVYGSWSWRPEAMCVSRVATDHLTPFWKDLALRGYSVTVLDVPFASVTGLPKGVEITEWGAHDWVRGRLEVSPPDAMEVVTRSGGIHPFAAGAVDATGPRDHAGLSRLISRCLTGVRQRGTLALALLSRGAPDLCVVVFPEVHRASHFLWHTVDPTHAEHDRQAVGLPPSVTSGLRDVYREVDRQVGRLVEAVGAERTVLVFSLHGMRGTRGVPTILDPLLRSMGLAAVTTWGRQSWPDRIRSVLGVVKRRVPAPVRRLLSRPASRAVMLRLVQLGIMPAYDWSRTVAFPLPTDQHGWLRLNLVGREAHGIVNPGQYGEICSRLDRLLRGLATKDGCPLVRDVIAVARYNDGLPPMHLPDLIVHWHDAASAAPLRLTTPAVSAYPMAAGLTGQHAPVGFFIVRWAGNPRCEVGPAVAAEELHRLIAAGLGAA